MMMKETLPIGRIQVCPQVLYVDYNFHAVYKNIHLGLKLTYSVVLVNFSRILN